MFFVLPLQLIRFVYDLLFSFYHTKSSTKHICETGYFVNYICSSLASGALSSERREHRSGLQILHNFSELKVSLKSRRIDHRKLDITCVSSPGGV